MRPSFQRSRETRTGRSASGTQPSASQSVMERRSLKRLLPSLLETCVKSGPFAPRALPRFLTTMSRSDSRPTPANGYGFPSAVAPSPARVAGSPRTLHPSVIARPPRSPRTARCVRVLVTSAPVAGFSTFGRLAAAIGVTRPNRVRLRWARDFAHHDSPLSCARLHRSAGPTRFAHSVTLLRRAGATW